MQTLKYLCLIVLYSGLGASMAMSMGFRGGARGGGTVRVGASTTFRPGVGVTHSTTLEAGRYHVPVVHPAYRPGVGYPGAAIRTVGAVAITRNVMYRTAAGYSYYYGEPMGALPTPACFAVMWEGMSAYSCDGMIYAYDGNQYYPVQGA